MIKKTVTGVALAATGALLLGAAPAMAQVEAGSHEAHIYAGQLFGDDLTDSRISGKTPKLDDDFVGGLRYGYNFTDSFGLEGSLGYNPNSVTGLAGSDIDIDLTTIDLNAVWHFNSGSQLVPYLTAGIGYASADLDRPIRGTVNGQPVSIDDDSGFTANAGAGLKYFATDRVILRVDARYRYMDALVDNFDDSLGGIETTIGIGWKF